MKTPSRPHLVGALAGATVAILFIAAAFVIGVSDAWFPPEWSLVIAVLVAGTVGGWLVGPSAWQATGRAGWLGVILALAIIAIPLGDLATVVSLLVFGTPSQLEASKDALSLVAGAGGLLAIGLLVVGPFAAPFTIAAATVWALLMRIIRGGGSASRAAARA